ncbi:hypothetical protein C1H46_008744 [Malus baccata]|uniref:Uncharacterized protein n=1 Tax=Malus baccata TaxID=106549 RepID=A0A540N3J3_MALBA|nr:hypothetical protein C1H46_008744 [Malus baccata]
MVGSRGLVPSRVELMRNSHKPAACWATPNHHAQQPKLVSQKVQNPSFLNDVVLCVFNPYTMVSQLGLLTVHPRRCHSSETGKTSLL